MGGHSAAVDEARGTLTEMTKPGVVTDLEEAASAAQSITAARFAHFSASGAVYPSMYPPPAAGDGSDVFKAADEGGEGKCTRKEIAKYLMRNQTLRHRLREGWAKFNTNFGTEDIPENHEELDQAQFCALWAEAAAMRADAAASGAAQAAPVPEVDAARSVLAEMTKPGVVTEMEEAAAAAQAITTARFAHFAQSGAVYPSVYPPPAAGDGSDVFKAADEGGEGKCTRKEIAKYLMRNQTLRHRLREGWAKFNTNFGTEDIPENHEELDQAQFCALWAEAAAMRADA